MTEGPGDLRLRLEARMGAIGGCEWMGAGNCAGFCTGDPAPPPLARRTHNQVVHLRSREVPLNKVSSCRCILVIRPPRHCGSWRWTKRTL